MMRRAGVAFALGMALSGCAVVGPLADRDMSGARAQACVNLAAPAAAPQCFVLAEQGEDGRRGAWTGGPLRAGRVLIAVHRPAAGCRGTFTHLVVSGASQAAGRAQLATWDVHGRAGHSREVRWEAAFADRSFALADIGSTLMNPGGARIAVNAGSLDVRNLCFKSY